MDGRTGGGRRDILKAATRTENLGSVTRIENEDRNDDDVVGQYNVGINPNSPNSKAAVETSALNIRRELNLGSVRNIITGTFTKKELKSLRELPGVEYVEIDGFYEPLGGVEPQKTDATSSLLTEKSGSYPWGLSRIGALEAHENGYTGEGADIVIVDTGVNQTHEALVDNLGTGETWDSEHPDTDGPSDCTEEERRYDSVSCETPWDDDQFHGTHVAGSAAAVDMEIDSADISGQDLTPNNVSRIAGVAPEATIHSAAVFEWYFDGYFWWQVAPFSNTAAAYEWAVDSIGADVINASLGGSTESRTVEDAIQYAVNNNIVFVAAAGNDGEACDGDEWDSDPDNCVSYPARYNETIAVANSTPDDEINSSSSRGEEVDVAAPGTDIMSTWTPHEDQASSTEKDFYHPISGTSMAAPHVAGLAALLKAETPLEDNEEIRTVIEETAEDIDERDVEQGEGLIDVMAAIQKASGDVEEPTVDAFVANIASDGVVEETIEAGNIHRVTIENLWIDWEVDWNESDADVDDRIESEGVLEFSWSEIQDIIGLSPSITPNGQYGSENPKYTGGEYLLTVTAEGPEDSAQATATIIINE